MTTAQAPLPTASEDLDLHAVVNIVRARVRNVQTDLSAIAVLLITAQQVMSEAEWHRWLLEAFTEQDAPLLEQVCDTARAEWTTRAAQKIS